MTKERQLEASTKCEKPALDFSGLLDDEPAEKRPPYLTCEPFLEGREYVLSSAMENTPEAILRASNGIGTVADPARNGKAAGMMYQERTKETEQLQIEIMKGIQEGENVYRLFLKAGKAISVMTANQCFYDVLAAGIRDIYGEGLQEGPVAEIELEEVRSRLEKLEEANRRELGADSRERIHNAIKAHREKEKALENVINRPV